MLYVDGWKVFVEICYCGDMLVIMLIVFDQDIDKLIGLCIGVDDYVVKLFNLVEVVVCVQVVLCCLMVGVCQEEQCVLCVVLFEIDFEYYEVMVEVDGVCYMFVLMFIEFKLFVQFVCVLCCVFSCVELMVICLLEGDVLECMVDSYVSKLCKKFDDFGVVGVLVSVCGVGYKLWSGE